MWSEIKYRYTRIKYFFSNKIYKERYSISQFLSDMRAYLAVIAGLIGTSLLYYSMTFEDPNKSISFLGRLGEVLITAGLFTWIIEKYTIDKFLTKQISVSIIQDLFRYYFNRQEMIDLIVRFSKSLNQYENIDEDIWALYERHGVVELFKETIRENLNISISFIEEVKGSDNLIKLHKSWSFKAKNTAHPSTRENLSKYINRDGLVHSTTIMISDEKIIDPLDIEDFINKEVKLKFYYTKLGCSGSYNAKREKLKPFLIKDIQFDKKTLTPIGVQPEDNPKLFLVYKIDEPARPDGMKYLVLQMFLNEKIPPGDSAAIEFTYGVIEENFNVVHHDFMTYTLSCCLHLNFDDEFRTDISEGIIGNGFISSISPNEITYSGWIMPHSSISIAWAKK